jgi:hypothetical protein
VATDTIIPRFRQGVRDAIEALAPTGFEPDQIKQGKTLAPKDIENFRAIKVANARQVERRLPSPAGMRRREILTMVAISFMGGGDVVTLEDQEDIVETLKAAFDRAPSTPAALLAIPELEETSVGSAESFIPQALRSHVDVHRFTIAGIVCQLAGQA